MREIWKNIADCNGRYKVSNLGRVMSEGIDSRGHNRRMKILKPKNDGWGYLYVGLRVNGKTINKKIHVLVADAFIGTRINGMQIDHIDGNKSNNCIENLRIVTRYENYKNTITYKNHPYKEKPVIKMDLKGCFISEYKSIHEAAKLNHCSASNISSACRGIYKTSGGFKWAYKS